MKCRANNNGKKIRVAIIGVGNCASSLVQGIHHYRNLDSEDGLMHADLAGYRVGDVEFTAAFDVNRTKVGLDLSEAIFAKPNNTLKFAEPPSTGVEVKLGPVHDGIGHYLRGAIELASGKEANVAKVLRDTGTEVVVSYLPVGSELATRWYVEQILEAGCAFINCIPVFIASQAEYQQRFEQKNLPLIGDDIKSQIGATIIHRVFTNLIRERGANLTRTYQLNFGGNTDFLNMLERERLESKRISKTDSVLSQAGDGLLPENVHIGPSDYVPWLEDRKFCHIRMEGTNFGNSPFTCEIKLEVWDSPNSAGVVIDAIRCAKIALDRGIGGPLIGPSAYFMKSPPKQFTDDQARLQVESFILGTPFPVRPTRPEFQEGQPECGTHMPDIQKKSP